MQQHSVAITWGPDRCSVANWALSPDRKLMVFVHGFGGAATSTWCKFQRLILSDPRWSGWDILFYGYASRQTRAQISSDEFEAALSLIVDNPSYADPWVVQKRSKDFRYDRICFVAHSLGAVVVRRALLNNIRSHGSWASISSLICFAPATGGARIVPLMWSAGACGGLFGIFNVLLQYKWTVLSDLKVGSPFLKDLLRDTKKIARSLRQRSPLYSEVTVFGSFENVIEYPPSFEFDQNIDQIHRGTHTDICKPRKSYDHAYNILMTYVRP